MDSFRFAPPGPHLDRFEVSTAFAMVEMISKAVWLSTKIPPEEMLMYSPKIKEDLIPVLYRLAKKQSKPMTEVVDEILREKIAHLNEQEERGCGV